MNDALMFDYNPTDPDDTALMTVGKLSGPFATWDTYCQMCDELLALYMWRYGPEWSAS